MNTARAILVLLAALAVGLVGYQIGITQNIAVQVPAGTAVAPAYWYGPHMWGFGFGFLGFLVPLFFLFLFFGLMRAAFGGRHHHGGYGMRAWSDERRAYVEQLHRELHGEKPAGDRPNTNT